MKFVRFIDMMGIRYIGIRHNIWVSHYMYFASLHNNKRVLHYRDVVCNIVPRITLMEKEYNYSIYSTGI